jgi:glucose-1-phosphate thymidylyltransferase
MKIIIPMAGRGSRLRPHTLTIPKPLIPIAGKPIVHRLVEDIAGVIQQSIEEVAFIIHESFGKQVEEDLIAIAHKLNAKGTIYYQNEALGTGHAIMCAQDSLSGPTVIAYADTLFRADFELDPEADSVIWVKKVDDPSQFGVVSLDEKGHINGLVEKPENFVTDLAVIGIYYFKEASILKAELQKVLDAKLTHGGEYQINDGIKAMMASGKIFVPGTIDHWMDCGNKDVTLETNSKILNFLHLDGENNVSEDLKSENSTVIQPCYVGKNVTLTNCTIGPNVSIGSNSKIENSIIKNSLLQNSNTIKNANLDNAMIGNNVYFDGTFKDVSLGDYSTLK